jgi:hypothetical protein
LLQVKRISIARLKKFVFDVRTHLHGESLCRPFRLKAKFCTLAEKTRLPVLRGLPVSASLLKLSLPRAADPC